MQQKHRRTLESVFENPTRSGVAWRDLEAMLKAPPIAMIPIIDSPGDVAARRRTRVITALVALTIVILIAVLAR